MSCTLGTSACLHDRCPIQSCGALQPLTGFAGLCRRSAPEAPANIAAIRLAAYKGQLDAAKQASDAAEQASDAAEQASDAAAAAAAEAAQAASPLQQGTSSQARAAVARAVLCSPAKPDDLPVLRRSMSRDPLRSSLRMEPMQGGGGRFW